MISNGLVLNHFQLNGKSFNMENDMSIDNVSSQEWDAYNRRRIQAMKDPNNYNKEGMTDQESLIALDKLFGTSTIAFEDFLSLFGSKSFPIIFS